MTGPGVDGRDGTDTTTGTTTHSTTDWGPWCDCDRPYWPDWVEFAFLALFFFGVIGGVTLIVALAFV